MTERRRGKERRYISQAEAARMRARMSESRARYFAPSDPEAVRKMFADRGIEYFEVADDDPRAGTVERVES